VIIQTGRIEREDNSGKTLGDRKRNRRRVWLGSAAVLLVIWVGVTARLFVYPSLNRPSRADAIVVLGGVQGGVARGLALSRAGYAPILAVSSGAGSCPAGAGDGVQVICFRPEPFTTQGEAREIRRLSARDHWRKVIVVVRRSQATRARLRVDRCYNGAILLDAPRMPLSGWAYNIAYEWGALVKALVWQRSC
jgi:uncharacterized SAM-binding protein YcdF (DUF218 family)